MIYRIGVKGDHEGLQSVDIHLSMSSLPVVFRSGLCLQQAAVTGEKPAFHSRQEKAVGCLWPEKDKHGLKTEVNWLLAFACWEKESGCHASLHLSKHSTVCGSGWGDPPDSFWRCISSLEKDEKTSGADSEQLYSQTNGAARAWSLIQPLGGVLVRMSLAGMCMWCIWLCSESDVFPGLVKTLETARCATIAIKQLFSLA